MLALLGVLCLSAHAAPAMVTTTNGDVRLVVDGGKADPAPATPFLLKDGMQLKLSAGAQAVLLYNGTAKRFVGPATATPSAVEGGKAVSGAGKSGSMLDELLAVQHSQAQAGAHRGGVQLVRPVPGGDILALKEIRWSCEACGEQTVEVVDFLEGQTVWTGKGTGAVSYAGPALTGDSYQIAVGDERFTVYVAGESKKKMLEKATEAAHDPIAALEKNNDHVGATSVLTGLYAHIGLESEALYLIDAKLAEKPGDKGLLAIRDGLEQRTFPAQ
ncbi:MAG: hypothetical protein H6737_19465 [Alphaproteobacteria bacterium]|nr:hypothetical protein [Alphaproteobacteria bacterium]